MGYKNARRWAHLSSNEGADVSTGGGSGAGSGGPASVNKALLKYFFDKLKPDFTYETKKRNYRK